MIILVITSVVIAVLYGLNKMSKGSNMNSTNTTVSCITTKYGLMIDYLADKYNIDNGWIVAIIATESSGDPNALGGTPDIGLMQITQPALNDFNTHFDTNIKLGQLSNPDLNLNVGIWYFANLYYNFASQSYKTAVRMYNAGIGNVRRKPTAGITYYNRVKSFYNIVLLIKGM